MAMSMPSEELQLLVAGYVLGDLSPEEAAEFEHLVAENPAIAAEVTQMQRALEAAYAPPEVAPPEHLRSAILNQVQAEVPNGTPRVRPAGQRRLPWRGLLEVAAAVIIIALGVNNYRLWQAVKTARIETQKYATLSYALAATRGNSDASAIVEVDPNILKARLKVKNLPPLSPGKVYALWTVLKPNAPFTTDEKSAILTEVFQVDEQGNFSQVIAVPRAFRSQELVTKVAITVEDAHQPQKHRGSPILITGL
jgi:anti-sigma-K factor RskA